MILFPEISENLTDNSQKLHVVAFSHIQLTLLIIYFKKLYLGMSCALET